jgi:hypothetical protein
MPEESVERRGAKWVLVVLLVSAVFAGLFILGYFTNISKRGSVPINRQTPTSVNGNH